MFPETLSLFVYHCLSIWSLRGTLRNLSFSLEFISKMFQHFLGRRSFYSRQPNRDSSSRSLANRDSSSRSLANRDSSSRVVADRDSSSRSLANRDSSSRSLLRNVATVLGEVGRVEIFHHGFPRRLRSLLRNVSIFLGKCFSKNVETF